MAVHQRPPGPDRGSKAGTGPDDYVRASRSRAAGSPRSVASELVSRVYARRPAPTACPPYRSFVLGGRGTLVGEPFRAYGGREVALGPGRVAVRGPDARDLPRLVRLHRPRMTVAPFVAAGRGGPLHRRPAVGRQRRRAAGRRGGARVVHAAASGSRPESASATAISGSRWTSIGTGGGCCRPSYLPQSAYPAARPAGSRNRQSRSMQFTDEWLVHTIEPLLPEGGHRGHPPGGRLGARLALGDPGPAQAARDDQESSRPSATRFRIPGRGSREDRPQAAADRPRAGGPPVQRRAGGPDRLLPRGRHRQPVRHRRREDAGLRDRARGADAARLARRRSGTGSTRCIAATTTWSTACSRAWAATSRSRRSRTTRRRRPPAPRRRASGRSSGWWT